MISSNKVVVAVVIFGLVLPLILSLFILFFFLPCLLFLSYSFVPTAVWVMQAAPPRTIYLEIVNVFGSRPAALVPSILGAVGSTGRLLCKGYHLRNARYSSVLLEFCWSGGLLGSLCSIGKKPVLEFTGLNHCICVTHLMFFSLRVSYYRRIAGTRCSKSHQNKLREHSQQQGQ